VGLDGKNLLQLTKEAGTHNLNVSPRGTYYIDTWHSLNNPGAIIAYDRNGRLMREIHKFEQPVFDPSKHAKAELVKIKTSDGLFDMPAIITYPLNFNSSKKYPVVFQIYGGPDYKNVYNRWQGTTPSWYAENGIITISVDHRASGHFGKKGLDYMYRSFGKWEILDYSDAVKWLREKPFVDASKMGIMGTSYGGYVTCLALTKGADFWTHGIATAPVTDFRLYDNIYTERYMNTPQNNPDGYNNGSALNFVDNFKGKLLLNHGDMDDNVHLQNSIQFISKMQDAGKQFEFMLYPGERHGWRGAKAVFLRDATYKFWLNNFFGEVC
jgi:dipeptidyl-peptidase-4